MRIRDWQKGVSWSVLSASLLTPWGLAGCGGGLEDGFETSLTSQTSCADILMAARNEDDSIALIFRVEGLSAEAHSQNSTITREFTFASDVYQVEVRTGTHVSDLICDDVGEQGSDIRSTYVPISGSGTLSVTPDGEQTSYGSYPGHATVELNELVLENQDDPSDTVPLPHYLWENVSIGWLPG